MSEPAVRRVKLLALPETTPAAIYGLAEVFAAVGIAWSELTGEPAHTTRMPPSLVAARTGPIRTAAGPLLQPEATLAEAGAADIVIVTDLALGRDFAPRGRWPEETAWLRQQFETGATVCSVCTGSLCLAEAGLLQGEDATTHWAATDLFARHYPEVRLRPERILCHAGPGQRIVTGGGSGAWTDLALHLIARHAGAAEAVRMAKVFLLGDHADGQLPYTAMQRHRYHEDAVVGECQGWIAKHYAEPNPVARMVAHSKLPERTFKRRFKAATGYTPVGYVQALRIEEAKEWLESGDESTESIAGKVGYEDAAYFRKLFKRHTGITPARYRQRFRPIRRSGRQGALA